MRLHLNIGLMGLILVGIPLFAQLVFLVVLVVSRADQTAAQRLALRSAAVLAKAETCHRLLVEAQTDMRGYALTELDTFAKMYETSRNRIAPAFVELRHLVEDSPDQSRRAEQLERTAGEFVAWMDDNVELLRNRKRDEVAFRIQALSGLRYLEELRKLLGDFRESEDRTEDQRRENLQRAMAVQEAILSVGGILTLASCAALLFGFRRYITQRLDVLMENTSRLAEGKELAAPLPGKDELAALDRMFHQMVDILRQKEQENELFVYSVSHDLRAPLVNLQGFSQELGLVVEDLRGLIDDNAMPGEVKDRMRRLLDRDAAEAIHFIQTAVTRLAAIIDAVLRLSRAGRVQYRSQEVNVTETVRRIVSSLRGSLNQVGASAEVQEVPPCWGDPTALDQVFGNLLNNAILYLDPDRPGRIEVGALPAEPSSPLVTYFVRDNGLGIPEAVKEKVFVAFQRLHPEVGPGEGIGLALVRRVVERHGGRIWLESRVGEGTTFYLTLPRDANHLPVGQALANPSGARG